MTIERTDRLGPTGHWRSLDERDGGATFLERLESEFPEGASEAPADDSRRRFLQVMSASIALAGLAGCEWPEEEIVPFGKRPEGYRPGRVARFATTFEFGGRVRPVLVSSYDGRPIKVEGNPEHPLSRGAADVWSQATVLDLYDPDRSRSAFAKGRGIAVKASPGEVDEVLARHRAGLLEGKRVAFLAAPSTSPTRTDLVRRLREIAPNASWYVSGPFDARHEVQGTSSVGLGVARAAFDLEKADVIVDLEADLLGTHVDALTNARGYALRRNPDAGNMSRVHAFEACVSSTGTAADHRFPVPSSIIGSVLVLVARALLDHGRLDDDAGLRNAFASGLDAQVARRRVAALSNAERVFAAIDAVVDDLTHAGANAAIAVGMRQMPAVHALAWEIHRALGAVGNTVRPVSAHYDEPDTDLVRLTAALNAGEVDTIFVLDANPIHDAPAGLEFSSAYAKASHRIHVGLHRDETAQASTWHIPMSHVLEAWGDAIAPDGSVCAVQPLIEPLYETRSVLEVLSRLIDTTPLKGHDLVRRRFGILPPTDESIVDPNAALEIAWHAFLHDGFQPGRPAPITPTSVRPAVWQSMREDRGSGLELEIVPCAKVLDGRFANNAWLQELPDAVQKLTWDNALLVSVAYAREHGLNDGDVVRVTTSTSSLEAPVVVQPGQARGTAALAAGYGRTHAGRVGDGVGVNAWTLVDEAGRTSVAGVQLEKTGRKITLASTQEHYLIDERGFAERERRAPSLAREGTLSEYREHPEFAEHRGVHHPPLVSLWEENDYSEGPQWAMAIDLNTCTGCNACVTACQAENNIPVVGRDQVTRGREMHWMRIDRYFVGDPDEPAVSYQPVGCAQCELAPCESVCPVGATMHSTEGLNVMAYNRCVGTRYCANNCPYKVRRFNFYDFREQETPVESLAHNPEVTIRSRGVMEKCTYCVQRIEHARINAKVQRRPMRDGDVVTACQQTCPTQAITFGDRTDPDAVVTKAQKDHRAYQLLGELNLKPRTMFLARIRNPHPSLAPHDTHGGGHGDDHDAGAAHHG